jgi:hypothetical protein
MAANLVILFSLAAFAASAQLVSPRQTLPKFMGREVTITDPGTDDDGFFPKGPAAVCIEGPPQRQCYTTPKDFGRFPAVTLVQVEKTVPALLFSADSGGVSGIMIHFALLHPGTGATLENIFPDISVSNQGEHEFWNLPELSDAPIFATADFIWGPDESHYSEHRYIVSTYTRQRSSLLKGLFYYLEDQYMTTRKYDFEKGHTLSSERPEILARLRRVKAEDQRRRRIP